jgi:hypothetical protein
MRALKGDEFDPKGLIAEAYNIEGITPAQCRTIFLDFALSLEGDSTTAINILLKRFDREHHPMTDVLRDGLSVGDRPRRRGGWRSRERP